MRAAFFHTVSSMHAIGLVLACSACISHKLVASERVQSRSHKDYRDWPRAGNAAKGLHAEVECLRSGLLAVAPNVLHVLARLLLSVHPTSGWQVAGEGAGLHFTVRDLSVRHSMHAVTPFSLAAQRQAIIPHRKSGRDVLPVIMSSCPLEQFLPDCPLTGASAGTNQSQSQASFIDAASEFLDEAETQLMQSAGLAKPLAVSATETAIETLLRTTCEEIGSLTVSVRASSSASFVLRGQVLGTSVEATGLVAYGLRASKVALSSDGLDIDIGNPIEVRPPNLRAATRIGYSVRLTQDDITRSPVLFGALQEIVRELLRTGVSAAIREYLPEGTLRVQLVAVEALEAGRLVLVADAEVSQADGSILRLKGLRVRTRPRAQSNLLVLDLPELISTFEGFGAKLEVGLPFLRAAGIPLPECLRLSSLVTDNGALVCEGAIELQPIDYDLALRQLQDIASAAAAAEPNAVTVEREEAADEDSNGPERGNLPALRAGN